MTAISLGNNAFHEQSETFLPVDTDKDQKQLPEKGTRNGMINSPDPQASQLDAVESEIIQKITQTAQQTRQALNNHFVGFNGRLSPIIEAAQPTAVVGHIRQIKNKMKQNLDAKLAGYLQDSTIKREAWQGAKKAYDKFQNENNLTQDASYLPLKTIIIFFGIIIVVEAVLNTSLLWELTGLLPAFMQTILITSVNVVFGAALAGLLFRYKNLVSPKRWLALISFPVFILVLVFNLGVGHYRDALNEAKTGEEQCSTAATEANPICEQLNVVDYTQEAMKRIISSPFGLDSVLSVLLILVGIGFFGFATYKWYSMFDPHPGYRKLDKSRKETHESYTNLKSTARKEMEQVIKNAEALIDDERTKAINIRREREDLINRAKRLRENYIDWIDTLGTQQTHLLMLYRDSNRQVRSEPPPGYFNSDMPIDESLRQPPIFTAPDEVNMERVVEAVESTIHEINAIADDHWEHFGHEQA